MIGRFFNQSCVQIKASTVSGDNELLKVSNTRHLLLKADSEATLEIMMANTSRVITARVGYFCALTFHQFKMSKSIIFASHPSNKYQSTSDLHSKSFSTIRC
jgi:hypothetical protein